MSLSARRAWIEIYENEYCSVAWLVALRKESVDRNINNFITVHIVFLVALRKESVDRNFDAVQVIIIVMGRSPQGERG